MVDVIRGLDDATGKVPLAIFGEQEDAQGFLSPNHY
jgi:hypothetical protein